MLSYRSPLLATLIFITYSTLTMWEGTRTVKDNNLTVYLTHLSKLNVYATKIPMILSVVFKGDLTIT